MCVLFAFSFSFLFFGGYPQAKGNTEAMMRVLGVVEGMGVFFEDTPLGGEQLLAAANFGSWPLFF